MPCNTKSIRATRTLAPSALDFSPILYYSFPFLTAFLPPIPSFHFSRPSFSLSFIPFPLWSLTGRN